MTEIVLFGGTAEGRKLGELLGQKRINTLLCVATEYGESLMAPAETIRVHTGRLDQAAMEDLLQAETPRLVIDATHPYAAAVSDNIQTVCAQLGVKRIRVLRETLDSNGCLLFSSLEELIFWLNTQSGIIFSALGAKEAPALTAISDYQKRVWLRILPDEAGLSACLAAGFPASRIICMQGPFSQELNTAMFRAAGADILLTKETGQPGGYAEKLEAARECGMTAAVLSRPRRENGLTLAELIKLIEEGAV